MICPNNIFSYIVLLPVIGSLLLIFIPSSRTSLIRSIGLGTSLLTFTLSLFLWVWFDQSISKFQFVMELLWLPEMNINLSLGVDGISLFFVLLTTLLIPLCLLASWNSVKFYVKEYFIAFLIMEAFLIVVFCAMDLLLFYIFFESVLIPMFLIIGIWGSRERKIRAAYMFFLYTLIGSVLMLLGILYIYYTVGTTDYEVLLQFEFSELEQKVLFLAFFCVFSNKNTNVTCAYLVARSSC
jgi:NADH:ubiquinone oxidoreductase subunit 4 (subunit M)